MKEMLTGGDLFPKEEEIEAFFFNNRKNFILSLQARSSKMISSQIMLFDYKSGRLRSNFEF